MPVLPATNVSGTAARVPVPCLTTVCSSEVTVEATFGSRIRFSRTRLTAFSPVGSVIGSSLRLIRSMPTGPGRRIPRSSPGLIVP